MSKFQMEQLWMPADLFVVCAKLYNFHFLEYSLENAYGAVNLLLCMCCHKCKTYQGVCRCTCWWYYRVNEYATVECLCRYCECLFHIAYIKRNDRRLCVTNLETFFLET